LFVSTLERVLRALRWTALAATVACGPRVQVLYPHPEVPRAPGDIATISGPIASIDEGPVSARGKVFHVLPGCHVVRVKEKIGEMNAEGSAGWSARLPPLVYAFQARPAHAYSIEIDARQGTGLFGQLSILAVDRGPGGSATPIAPTTDPLDVRLCLRRSPTELLVPEEGPADDAREAGTATAPKASPVNVGSDARR
jgi:hypothetical protein